MNDISDVKVLFEVDNLYVHPIKDGYTDVIAKVDWTMTFEYGGHFTAHPGETLFYNFDKTNFKNINDVTDDEIEGWVMEKIGGDITMNTLKQNAKEMLTDIILRETVVLWK